jgi:hypothetical protein
MSSPYPERTIKVGMGGILAPNCPLHTPIPTLPMEGIGARIWLRRVGGTSFHTSFPLAGEDTGGG